MKVNQLKAGVILTYIQLIVGNIISIIYTPIMLRILGQNEYGLYNLSSSTISYLGLLSFGFGSAYIRYYSKYKVENNKDEIKKSWIIDREFIPNMSDDKRNLLYKGWKKAVSRSLLWAKEDEEFRDELSRIDS